MKLYKVCPSCGAKLTYAEELQTNCSYCGEPLLMNVPDDAIRAEAVRRNLFGRKRTRLQGAGQRAAAGSNKKDLDAMQEDT